ncbi:hypothetical protein [Phaeobacter sp. C3_T13_0]|uniref:hypothetical protein n=1 Tax=Phaeobacter cretensis TaxID=3342641 RepID=UPI0039BD62DD
MTNARDDFPASVRRALAARAGHRCSLCKTPTSGPSDEAPEAVTNVGVAAHITAAAPGRGARRYDPSLTTEERRGVDNGIWLCGTCSIMIDRDEAVFSVEALRTIRSDHTEFARLGYSIDADVGLISLGPDIVAAGRVLRVGVDGIVVRLSFFLVGTAQDLLAFVHRFEELNAWTRYALLSEAGLGGRLSGVPVIERDSAAWLVTLCLDVSAPRLPANDLSGMCNRTGALISGEAYWIQYFETALALPPRTWFANMDGGSHITALYETLKDSVWFEHLVACELIRMASVSGPPSMGATSKYPPLVCVRQVRHVGISDTTLYEQRLRIEVEFDLEGHGRWVGELKLYVYDQETLRIELAKAAWMSEAMRRAKAGEGMLPSLLPPEGWTDEDGFPN